MKSKKSLCNKTLISNDLHRFLPLFIAEVVLYQLFITLPIFTDISINARAMEYDVLFRAETLINGINTTCSVVLALLLGITIPFFLFSYLNKEKEAYTIHSFPIKREVMFFSHYISGLVLLLVPMILTLLLLGLFNVAFSIGLPNIVFQSMLCAIIEYLFFYNLGCTVMMLSGNNLIAILCYAVINAFLPGIEFLFTELQNIYTYCNSYNTSGLEKIVAYAPAIYFEDHTTIFSTSVEDGYGRLINQVPDVYNSDNLKCILICIIPMLLLLGIAVFLYKKRSIEEAGETMVFPWAKAVFRFVFTLCASILLTVVVYHFALYPLLKHRTYTEQFPVTVGIIIICGFICYYLSNVIVQKSFRVWKTTPYWRCVIILAGIIGIMFATKDFKPNDTLTNTNKIVLQFNVWDEALLNKYNIEMSADGDVVYYHFEGENLSVAIDLLSKIQAIGQNHPIEFSDTAGYVVFGCKDNVDNYYNSSYSFDVDETTIRDAIETAQKYGTRQYDRTNEMPYEE